VNFSVFDQWTHQGIYFVTRLNDDAVYDIIESQTNDIVEYTLGGVIRDEIIQLKLGQGHLRARKIPLILKHRLLLWIFTF